MSNYYEYQDVLVKIAHRLMKQDGWKVYGYHADESDSMTDYYSPAYWGGVAEKNGFLLVVNDSFGQKPYTEKRVIKAPNGEYTEKIQKLAKMTQDRGASEAEEKTAQAAIKKLQEKQEAETITEEIHHPGHMANPPRCNWHIEKDGVIYDKGNGILKFRRVPDISGLGLRCEIEEWQKYNTMTRDEWIADFVKDCIARWNDTEEEATRRAESNYNDSVKAYELLDKFNELLARFNNVCGGSVGNTESGFYTYEQVKVTKYKKELKPVQTAGKVAEGQCFILLHDFNYGCCKGFVYRIHERESINGGKAYYANRLGKGYKKERTGMATRSNYWYIGTADGLEKWINKGAIAFCELQEVKTPYEVTKTVKKHITPETPEEAPQEEPETMKDETNTTATEAESTTAPEIDENSPITEGMTFIDADGKTFTITELSDMSVNFNNGERSFYDFGTSRTIKAVIDGLGNGVKVVTATAPEEQPQDTQTATETDESETAEEVTAEPEKDDTTAEGVPDMFEQLAKAYATGSTVKSARKAPGAAKAEKATDTPTEEPESAPGDTQPEFTTGKTLGKLHAEIERNGTKYIIDAADLKAHGDTADGRYEVLLMTEHGDEVDSARTNDPAEARKAFYNYCETWTPAEQLPQEPTPNSKLLTAEEVQALDNGGQVRKENHGKNLYFATQYTDKTKLVFNLNNRFGDTAITPGKDAGYVGFISEGVLYTNSDAIKAALNIDIENAIRKALPDEESAKNNVDYDNKDDYRTSDIETYINSDYRKQAQDLFFKGDEGVLTLYGYRYAVEYSEGVLIEYIENPESVINEYATAYMKDHASDIYIAYIRHNRTAAELKTIQATPDDESHLLKKISDSIDDQKTVRIDLTNGNTVKCDADGVRRIIYCGYISTWNVASTDESKLFDEPESNYPRKRDIFAGDIVSIRHGQRTLYEAS